jgi:hypothetical protein
VVSTGGVPRWRPAQQPRHTTEKLNESRVVAAATPPLQNVLETQLL